jgi:hypothetical protein
LKDLFYNIYKSNKIQIKNPSDDEEKFESIIYKQFDNTIQAISLINTKLFEKLYLKIIFENKEKIQDDDIYDIFSFWFYLKKLKSILNDEDYINEIDISQVRSIDIKEKLKNPYLEKFVFKYLSRYLNSLFATKNKKANKQSEIKEDDIFDAKFYTCYESLIKIYKIKYIKFIKQSLPQLELNLSLPPSQQKDELTYIKSIYSMIVNNASHAFQIYKK